MPNLDLPDEVIVIRFFHTGPIETALAILNVASDLVQQRLSARDEPGTEAGTGAVHRRNSRRRSASRPAAPSSNPHDEAQEADTDPAGF